MKKNKAMRLASVLLILVLLTSSVVGGTFAKYVTGDDAQDSARVAKWGVTVTATGDDAFAPTYASNTAGVSGDTVVAANGTDNLLAPGTNGSLGGITITGAPEVMVDISVTADLTLIGWEVDGVEYCPVVFTAGGKTYGTIDGVDNEYDTIAALCTAIETALSKTQTSIAANTNLAGTYDFGITWAWAIDVDDAKDTALGNLATAPTIAFACSASVTQVD